MEYYSILNLKKEPFSNSPEPEFFYEAPKQISCLQKLELAVRLRRGINVVIGDVGTGKTTLCRKLIQQFTLTPKDSQEIETHLLLDPAFDTVQGFLKAICMLFGIKDLEEGENEWQLKEKIKKYLFDKGVNENKIVVLIIDEGQKIPESCIEVLREFLNYETNSFKLLQIIIFAQLEFKNVLKTHANLSDRVNYIYYLHNFNFKQMRDMINYRLCVARNFETSSKLFTFCAMLSIYMETRGYPRKVVSLCHHALLMLIIRGKNKADYFLLRDCIEDLYSPLLRRIRLAFLSMVLIASAALFVVHEPTAALNFYTNLISPVQAPAPQIKNLNLPVPKATAENKQVSVAVNVPVSVPAHVSVTESAVRTPSADSKINAAEEKSVVMPDVMGTLTVKQGRTLWRTINNIYGDVTPEIMEKISKVNPNIENMNAITTGQSINFPSIPVKSKPVKDGFSIVVLEKGGNLSAMYDIFHENIYKKTLPPMTFLSYWNSREGMTFAIVLDKNFGNRQAAKDAIGALPTDMAAKAQIISSWDAKSVFFNRQALKN